MNQGLVMIDQHAAHERVLYERYRNQWQAGGVSSQYLIIPILVELPPGWTIDLDSIFPELTSFGFEITSAGGNSLWIKSLPVGMSSGQGEAALKEILEEMKTGNRSMRPEGFYQSLLKLLACHSAIRAGQVLSPEEIKALLIQLDQTESPSHCPHGRPFGFCFPGKRLKNDSNEDKGPGSKFNVQRLGEVVFELFNQTSGCPFFKRKKIQIKPHTPNMTKEAGMMHRPKLVIITGPTAVGKSGLSHQLAREMGGEIINADSMQVYRHMDIGTAKPTLSGTKRNPLSFD